MISAELDMWSDDIRVDVRTPLAILRIQENLLAKKTRGILQAQAVSVNLGEHGVQQNLDLFAPALGYRETLLTAKHADNLVYPVTVIAKAFTKNERGVALPHRQESVKLAERSGNASSLEPRHAATEEEFVELVRQVLHSAEVRALIQSLIARSNELRPLEPPDKAAPLGPDVRPPSADKNIDDK